MKQTIYKDQFRHAFAQIRPDNFSYEGLGELFDFLESIDEDMELDVIALCCDFSQCSLGEFGLSFLDAEIDDFMTDEERRNAIADYIEGHGGWYCFVEDNKEILFQNF